MIPIKHNIQYKEKLTNDINMSSKSKDLKRIDRVHQLDLFELTGSGARDVLIKEVKAYYENGDIKKLSDAKQLIKLLQENKLTEFDEKFTTFTHAKNIKTIEAASSSSVKRAASSSSVKRAAEEPVTKIKRTRNKIEIKHKRSELPSMSVVFGKEHTNFNSAWKSAFKSLVRLAEKKIIEKKNVKVVLSAKVTIIKLIENETITMTIYANTSPETAYSESGIASLIANKKDELEKKIYERMDKVSGSGWSIKNIEAITVTTYTQTPSRGSSWFEVPDELKNSRLTLINIKNNDNECFKWCLRYHQSDKEKNGDRVSVLNKIKDKYNWEGVNFPTGFNDIETFENNNKVCVNVWQYENGKTFNPLRLGNIQFVKNDNINLLLLTQGEKSHYIYIKKLESLLATAAHKNFKNRRYCPYCRTCILEDEIYEDHLLTKHFNTENNCNLQLPAIGSTMKFKSHKNMMERPFICYCDFECSLIPTGMSDKIARHEPNSAMLYFVCTFDDSRNKLYKFEGGNCVINLLEQLRLLAKRCILEMQHNQEMVLTPEDEDNFNNATLCSICNKPFTESNKKVRDHCHRTGKFRGAAHNSCNINYFNNRYLPCVFHNLRGYDSHLIIKKAFDIIEMNKTINPNKKTKETINAIPNSGEKFMTFSIGNIKFIDSFQFMSDSLDGLVESLKSSGSDPYQKFTHMKKHFKSDEMSLVCKKGVYPYEYIDSYSKLYEKQLPSKEKFYSNVKLEGITDEEYQHAQHVYDYFKCKDFSDYHFLYLKTDVILLADVFENFRQLCLENFRLDPANYITSASLAWDALLLKSDIELELITDVEILDMFEKSKRGGLTFVSSKRWAKANNRAMGSNYNKDEESSYISYLDANNLYGWAMIQSIPYKNIKFDNDVTLPAILNTPDDSEIGYMVEADLEFPEKFHNKYRMFPPAPESIIPKEEWMSDYQKSVMEKTHAKLNCPKLIPHLFKHENYPIHYRNLKYLFELGVSITVKRVISFEQKPWMKNYIEDNNKLRTVAKKGKNKFLANLYKLFNNAVFGKSLEQIRNRRDIHLTTDRNNAIKHFSRLDFKSANFIDGLYLIESHKTQLVFDKPIYCGCSVLDLSKLHMMKFHFDVIHKNFDGFYDLLYSDTDSLVYQIKHKNFNKWMLENEEHFDLSEMEGKYKSTKNENVLGKFKSEVGSKIITEFCALSAKSYSFKYCDLEVKKAKGVSKAVTDKLINFEDYKRCMESNNIQTRPIYSIQSFNQQIYTTLTDKVSHSPFYDKMKLLDSINCVPYGYNPID